MVRRERLWEVEDHAARLAELTSNSPDLKEAPLRRDVRSLGRLLGQVLKEQAGSVLFDHVEHLRLLAIEHRDLQLRGETAGETAPNRYRLMEIARQFVGQVSVVEAYQLTKAFSTYFELTNLAETNHRKRRRRASELSRDLLPQRGDLRGTLLRMREAGIDLEQALEALQK